MFSSPQKANHFEGRLIYLVLMMLYGLLLHQKGYFTHSTCYGHTSVVVTV
jgi:hypothetical protein